MKPSHKGRIFSGMQPTGNLHLGNYLGALKNWANMQQDYDTILCVVDLHALTLPQDPAKLRQSSREVAAAYIASGIDVNSVTLFVQSASMHHTELSWLLSNHVPLGWLDRMTQFKDKAAKNRDFERLGLYSYPVLMAADILLYHATHVPVGEDQKQHLELARDVAGAFNRHYGRDYFPLPEPVILGEAARIMSLRDGTKKMSKSDESDYSRINLTDDADTIALKIRKAKTDTEPLPATLSELKNRPEAENLITIYAALNDQPRADVLSQFAGQNFSQFKPALAELAVAKISPISTRLRELLADPAELDRLLNKGAERVVEIGAHHMSELREMIGLWPVG